MSLEPNALLEKISQKASKLHERSKEKSWSHHNREQIQNVLNETVEDLKEMRSLVESLGESTEVLDASSAKKQSEELAKTIELLQRNIQFEQSRKPKPDVSDWFGKEIELGELWGSLEQKVLSTAINLHYFVERTQLQLHSPKGAPLDAKSGAGQLVQLLRTKEEELQHLRERYEKLKSNSNIAQLEEDTAPDLEHELNEIARKMDSEEKFLERTQVANRRQFESMQQHQLEVEKRVAQLQELVPRYMGKSLEAITILKKERDFAKKLVLDIEHEASALRTAYTKELLNFQENKLQIQKEAEQRFQKLANKQQQELAETKELLKQFQHMVQERERKIQSLEEENNELNTAKKLLEKHAKPRK